MRNTKEGENGNKRSLHPVLRGRIPASRLSSPQKANVSATASLSARRNWRIRCQDWATPAPLDSRKALEKQNTSSDLTARGPHLLMRNGPGRQIATTLTKAARMKWGEGIGKRKSASKLKSVHTGVSDMTTGHAGPRSPTHSQPLRVFCTGTKETITDCRAGGED